MSIALYVIAGLLVLDALSTVWLIGKPHKHTGRDAVVEVVVTAAVVVVLVMAAGRLG